MKRLLLLATLVLTALFALGQTTHSYCPLDQACTWTGLQTLNGGAALPSTSIIGSTTSLSANTCGDAVTGTLTGATSTNTLAWTLSGAPQVGLRPYFYISATNTVTFEYCNVTASPITPNSQTAQVRLLN